MLQRKVVALTALLLVIGIGAFVAAICMIVLNLHHAHWGLMFGISALTLIPSVWQAMQLYRAYRGLGYVHEI